MADHYTLVGGAAREIKGMTINIGGVAREVDGGLVLVNGVAREIVFTTPFTVTITGSGGDWANVSINGVTYTAAATLEVEPGTIVYCAVKHTGQGPGRVYLNSTRVAQTTTSNTNVTYQYTVQKNISISLSTANYVGRINITDR